MPTKPSGRGKKSRKPNSTAGKARRKRVDRLYKNALPAIDPENKAPVGRPSLYNALTANTVCELLANGETLVSICKREDMPAYRTVLDWRRKWPAFDAAYLRAREDGIHYLAESTVDLGERAIRDPDPKRASAYQVAIKANQWLAGKLVPDVYGENVNVHHGGGIQIQELRALDDRTLAAMEKLVAQDAATVDGEATDITES